MKRHSIHLYASAIPVVALLFIVVWGFSRPAASFATASEQTDGNRQAGATATVVRPSQTTPNTSETGVPISATLTSPEIISITITDTLTSTDTVSSGDTLPTDDPDAETYSLPFNWADATTIPAAELEEFAPPLDAREATGQFLITNLPTDDGQVIRLLPDLDSDDPGRSIRIAWRLFPDSRAPLPAGSVVSLSVWARLYSPPDGARLTIRDSVDGWASSSIPMQEISWTRYEIRRLVREDATRLQFSIDWNLEIENAWLEFRDMEVVIQSVGSVPAEELSPTDTPTPVTQPTATATPTQRPPQPEAGPTQASAEEPTARPTEPLSYVVVTSTPTPETLFAAATQVAMATEWSRVIGTATPTPLNMATATFTLTPLPTATPIVITNTPTPENAATATFIARRDSAIALTTGTPTPYPPEAVVLLATATPTPKVRPAAATKAPKATKTPTPFFVYFDDLPATPIPTPTLAVPDELIGNILFRSTYQAGNRNPRILMIHPDGTGLAVMTDRNVNHFYNRANEHDAYSADRRFYAYALREPLGGRKGLIQVYYDDSEYNSTLHQLTYFGVGTAWSPAFSPVDDGVIALVSSESANDEIWLARRNEWPPRQLTKNDWAWDHHPSFSPDGSQIVFASNRANGTRQLWLMDADGSNQRQLTDFPFEAWDPVWVKYKD